MNHDPRWYIPRTRYHKVVDILSLLILVVGLVHLVFLWPTIPEKIATHFNFAGEADGWGGRGSLIIFPIMSVFTYLILTVVAKFPQAWNTPFTPTEENRIELYQCTLSVLLTTKLVVIGTFSYLSYLMSSQKSPGISFIFIELAAIFVPIIYFMRKSYLITKR